MPISITDAWADDGIKRKSSFVGGSERMRFVCSFYISDDLLTAPFEGDTPGSIVYFDFTHIDWRNNNIYHNLYSPKYGPDPATGKLYNSWSVWVDFGVIHWEPALNWFQVIADTSTADDILIVTSPERFVRIFKGFWS